MYEKVCRALSTGDKQWLMIPFKQPDKGYRNIQMYVISRKTFEKKLDEYSAFFGQFGINPLSQPPMIITHVENSDAYDRWRGYGYLFGYPAHAVDFFVAAGKEQNQTAKFVERQFFHIPVFAASEGYFTYALPKNEVPTSIDSSIYRSGLEALKKYKSTRKKWVAHNRLKSKKIIRHLYK
jgi:hypothetical protein